MLGLLGCTNSEVKSDRNSGNNLEPENSTFPIEVGTFTTDELFAAGGGGCGMSLWQEVDSNSQSGDTIFFNGLAASSALMIFDGKPTKLTRTDARGENFYGQQTEQVFMTEDKAIAVEVKVNLGAEGEIESVAIPSGEITIDTQGKTKKFSVVGDAGC